MQLTSVFILAAILATRPQVSLLCLSYVVFQEYIQAAHLRGHPDLERRRLYGCS